MGRRTLLTDELVATLCSSLEVGNTITIACGAVGLERSLFYKWMRRGRIEDALIRQGVLREPRPREAAFFYFLHAVEQSQHVAEEQDVTCIAAAARTDWRAAAWRLERRFSQHWGQQRHVLFDLDTELEKACHKIANAFPLDVAEAILEVIRSPAVSDRDEHQQRAEAQLSDEIERERAYRLKMRELGKKGRRRGNAGKTKK
jgi:transposase